MSAAIPQGAQPVGIISWEYPGYFYFSAFFYDEGYHGWPTSRADALRRQVTPEWSEPHIGKLFS